MFPVFLALFVAVFALYGPLLLFAACFFAPGFSPLRTRSTNGRVSENLHFNDKCIPARTLLISGLKSRVLKLPFFYFKMMVKSGLDLIF